MNISKIPAIENDLVNAIIETPRGSIHKYVYKPKEDVFHLKKSLPLGMSFPFDFGFIPQTRAEDGDPVDILVLMDQPAFTGCLVHVRLVAVLEATQVEKTGKKVRNDRLVSIEENSILYKDVTELKQLNKQLVNEIERFFINYNERENKQFTVVAWKDADKARELIIQSL